MRGPIDRLTERLPAPWRTVVDWTLTIAIAVAAVLAIKAWQRTTTRDTAKRRAR